MSKSKTMIVADLPSAAKPEVSSTDLIARHIARLRAEGSPQKAVALDVGFTSSYLSDIKAGRQMLPVSRIFAFAAAAKLTNDERFNLLHARLAEEHGGNIDLCLHTLTLWADELCSPRGDEARLVLVAMWRQAREVHPYLHSAVLAEPARAALVADAMAAAIQAELIDGAAALNE